MTSLLALLFSTDHCSDQYSGTLPAPHPLPTCGSCLLIRDPAPFVNTHTTHNPLYPSQFSPTRSEQMEQVRRGASDSGRGAATRIAGPESIHSREMILFISLLFFYSVWCCFSHHPFIPQFQNSQSLLNISEKCFDTVPSSDVKSY